ncbi:MAG: rhodanese [Magnetovibrio sp.]|nr:rhodanese [Magnetovibrio sp.]|tara:strand:+ start:788 stop:1210 length:423 start_codon:yes stop_codon:yes gene_type:complete
MNIKIKKDVDELIAEAEAAILTLSTQEAIKRHNDQDDQDIVFVDIRDIRELQRDGTIPGSIHAPRGMLEFWFDPKSKYHKKVFSDENKTYVLFCAAAGRAALATKTLQDMGFLNVAHFSAGFRGWKESGGSVQLVKKNTK